MEALLTQFPALQFSSLPSFGTKERPYHHIELRISGEKKDVIAGKKFLLQAAVKFKDTYEIIKDTTA
jgi:hypothetical protein